MIDYQELINALLLPIAVGLGGWLSVEVIRVARKGLAYFNVKIEDKHARYLDKAINTFVLASYNVIKDGKVTKGEVIAALRDYLNESVNEAVDVLKPSDEVLMQKIEAHVQAGVLAA